MKNILFKLVRIIIGPQPAKVKSIIFLMGRCRGSNHQRLARYFSNKLKEEGVYISIHAKIADTVNLPHPIAVVIGEGVVVGENVRIYQNVTLGGARIGDWQSGNYPMIGENTVIFAGAVIVGKVKIGKNCVIGANSVVLSDVPDNSVCVGAPAKVVSANRKKES